MNEWQAPIMQTLSTVALQSPRIHAATYCLHPAHLGRWSTMTTCKVLQLCLCIWFCPSPAPPPPPTKHSLTTNWELQDMLVSFQITMESLNHLCRNCMLRLHICSNTKKIVHLKGLKSKYFFQYQSDRSLEDYINWSFVEHVQEQNLIIEGDPTC